MNKEMYLKLELFKSAIAFNNDVVCSKNSHARRGSDNKIIRVWFRLYEYNDIYELKYNPQAPCIAEFRLDEDDLDVLMSLHDMIDIIAFATNNSFNSHYLQ